MTYFFPPHNLTESRRALMIARAAVGAGWHVDVVAPWAQNFHSSGTYSDWTRFFPEPARLRVHRVPGGLQEALGRTGGFVGRWLARLDPKDHLARWLGFPDRCVSWAPFALAKALSVAGGQRPDLILSSSYPYTNHLVGGLLSRILRRPWIADTRDPWAVDDEEQFTAIEPSWRRRRLHRTLMAAVVKRAAQMWSITPGIRDATASFFAKEDPDKFVSVVHGCDLELESGDTGDPTPIGETGNGRPFILGYAGRFRRDVTPVEPILHALDHLRNGSPKSFARVTLRIWGRVSAEHYLSKAVRRHRLEDSVEILDALPEPRLVAALRGCDALLLVHGSSTWTQRRLTTKIFVYIPAGRPVLAICEPGSGLGELCARARLGAVASPRDPVAAARVLADWLDLRDRVGRVPCEPDRGVIESLSLQRGVMPLMAAKMSEAVSGRARPADLASSPWGGPFCWSLPPFPP